MSKQYTREQLEQQVKAEYPDKTPEEMMEIGAQFARDMLSQEKAVQKKESQDRMSAMRAIYNLCTPRPSDRFKK